jgi:Tfp pilus assembly protein PilX
VRAHLGMRNTQAGAALVIALLLLMILTLLSVTSMRTSVAELWMAGHEQFRQQAAAAASVGIETAIARIAADRAADSAATTTETYTVTVARGGRQAMLPGASVGRLVGENYEITSVGTAARNAREEQVQGVAVVIATEGVQDYRRIGSGLEEGTR